MERQSADLSTTAGSCRRYDSRRHSERRRPAAVGAQCRGGISGKSPHRPQGLSTTGQRGVGRDQARPRHVRQCRRARSAAQGRTAEVSDRPMARNRRHHSAARDHAEGIAESGQDYESKMRSSNLRNAALILSLSGSASLRETSAIQGREEVFTLRRQGAKRAFQCKSTIPFLNLSGSASLREPSVTQGRKTLFTLRRQGAKKASQSKSTIRSLDLSGFASLREPSVTQGRKTLFTLRRQGAKKASQSKSTIRSLDLSGFASLRETSATQGRDEFFTPRRQGAKKRNRSKYQRFFGHTIGDALNAVLDHVL